MADDVEQEREDAKQERNDVANDLRSGFRAINVYPDDFRLLLVDCEDESVLGKKVLLTAKHDGRVIHYTFEISAFEMGVDEHGSTNLLTLRGTLMRINGCRRSPDRQMKATITVAASPEEVPCEVTVRWGS